MMCKKVKDILLLLIGSLSQFFCVFYQVKLNDFLWVLQGGRLYIFKESLPCGKKGYIPSATFVTPTKSTWMCYKSFYDVI